MDDSRPMEVARFLDLTTRATAALDEIPRQGAVHDKASSTER